MICLPCRLAGDLNVSGRFADAEVWHSRCAYPRSCTCEHSLGDWTNRGNARS